MPTKLAVIDVENPCTESWDAMSGTDQVRHCSKCNLDVYNLSAMTLDVAAKQVEEREGRMCVRFFRRTDGTVLTTDCDGLRDAVETMGGLADDPDPAEIAPVDADPMDQIMGEMAAAPAEPVLVTPVDPVLSSDVVLAEIARSLRFSDPDRAEELLREIERNLIPDLHGSQIADCPSCASPLAFGHTVPVAREGRQALVERCVDSLQATHPGRDDLVHEVERQVLLYRDGDWPECPGCGTPLILPPSLSAPDG